MLKQSKIRSCRKISANRHSGRSVKLNNLSLSTTRANSYAEESKHAFSAISSAALTKSCESRIIPEQPQFSATAPQNVAVHFGNFYGLRNNVGEAPYGNHWDNFCKGEETAMKQRTRRLAFTRQMMHKLEKASDTEDYARQVSALLEETIEPPNFRLNPPPSENSIPNGSRGVSDYPLWYREPHEIPLMFSNPIAQPNA